MGNEEKDSTGALETLEQDIALEYDQYQRAIREIKLMLEQSQVELSKLSQRNAAITTHLQQVQDQFDSMPRADIRMAYDSALDAQQRLFVMRGQLEKLQSDQMHLDKFIGLLGRIKEAFPSGLSADKKKGKTGGNSFEMVINAQEAERKNLSRQMHDGPAQTLSNFILQTEIALRLFDIDQAKAREELNNLKAAAMGAFQKVRNFIFELRPMMLDDLGIKETVTRYGDSYKRQNGVDVSVAISGAERRLDPFIEVMIFRAVQELISNAARHGQASQIKVQINFGDSNVRVSVDDNGKGFDPESESSKSGLGLKIIRERVDTLGGSLEIDSVIGQGTRISFQVPLLAAPK